MTTRTSTSALFSAATAACFSATCASSSRRMCAFFSSATSASRRTAASLMRCVLCLAAYVAWLRCASRKTGASCRRRRGKSAVAHFLFATLDQTLHVHSSVLYYNLMEPPSRCATTPRSCCGQSARRTLQAGFCWRTFAGDARGLVLPDTGPLVALQPRLALRHHRVTPAQHTTDMTPATLCASSMMIEVLLQASARC